MRISDRSSDVCSSDLFYAYRNLWTACLFTGPGFPQIDPEKEAKAARMLIEMNLESREELIAQRGRDIEDVFDEIASGSDMAEERDIDLNPALTMAQRSEEHTSELQSLMRISYAVFCLKKKQD